MPLIIAAKAACVPIQLGDRILKGFKAVEIITFENQLECSLDSMMEILQNYSNNLEFVSIHAPSTLTISDAVDEGYRKRGLSCLKKTIRLASSINCKRVVFHAFQNVSKLGRIDDMISLRDKAFEKCVESILSLKTLCEDSGVTLCLENINACLRLNHNILYPIFTASPHDLLCVVEEVNSDFLKLCFDIAHAQNFCNFVLKNPKLKTLYNVDKLTPEEFYELISDNVNLIHLSDAKGTIAEKGTDNLPLGEGEVNLSRVLKAILVKGLKSPMVLEIDENDVNNAKNMVKSKKFLLNKIAELKLQCMRT